MQYEIFWILSVINSIKIKVNVKNVPFIVFFVLLWSFWIVLCKMLWEKERSVRPLFLDICTHVEQQLCPLTSSLSVSHAAVSPVSGVMKTSSGLSSEVTVMTASTLLRDFYLPTKINKGESAPALRQHTPSNSEWESEIKRRGHTGSFLLKPK